MIKIRLFASLRENLGLSELELPGSPGTRVADVWAAVQAHCQTDLSQSHVLAAVNMTYASMDTPVQDGDEIAFFPPVTGG